MVEVYFDDVVVTQTKNNLIQFNEYYPYGLQTANSWTRENTIGNQFLYNGGTELNATSAVYDLFFRNYDPALGRMNQVDPMASKYSSLTPYNFAFNDPVKLNDPLGDDVDPPQEHRQPICGYCWRDGDGMKFYNAATGGGGGMFDGFNSWVNSTVQANNIISGISSALNGPNAISNVNPLTGAVTQVAPESQYAGTGNSFSIENGILNIISHAFSLNPGGGIIARGDYTVKSMAIAGKGRNIYSYSQAVQQSLANGSTLTQGEEWGYDFDITFGLQAGFDIFGWLGFDANVVNVGLKDGKVNVKNSAGITVPFYGIEVGQSQNIDKEYGEYRSTDYSTYISNTYLGSVTETIESDVLGNQTQSVSIPIFTFKFFIGIEIYQTKKPK